MKNFTLICLLFITIAHAQDHVTDITNNWNSYNDLIINAKYEQAMESLHPGVFEIVNKQELTSSINSLVNHPELNFKFLGNNITAIHDEIETNDPYIYYPFDYQQQIAIRINDFKNEDDIDLVNKSLVSIIFSKYSKDKVKYLEEAECYNITEIKQAVAIFDTNTESWKFITINHDQEHIAMLEQLLPIQVLNYIYK